MSALSRGFWSFDLGRGGVWACFLGGLGFRVLGASSMPEASFLDDARAS